MKTLVVLAIGATLMVGCKKRKECNKARQEVGSTYQQKEAAENAVVENPTPENIAYYEQLVYEDSVANAHMQEVCSKCKSCN